MRNQYNAVLTSERVKSRAKELGLTISQLNAECNLSGNTIKNAGKGSDGMKAKNLFMIAEVLDCSVDYLLGISENPNQANTNCNVIEHGDNIGNMDITINQAENDFLSCFLKQFQSLTYSEQLEIMNIVNEKAKR